MDDVLFVYGVGHRTLCFIGRCNTPIREASPADIEARPERTRWSYWVNAINLTPTFGRQWSQQGMRLFDLVDSHNSQHPQQSVRTGCLNYGSDALRIPSSFAQVIVERVLQL